MAGPVRVVAFGLRALEGVEGGIETHARKLYPRLAALGFDVTVLTRAPYDSGRSALHEGCRTRALWAPRVKGLEAAVHSVLCAVRCLFSRAHVVHIHGVGPGICAALLVARVPVVVTHHGHDYDAAKWGWLARSVLKLAEAIGVRLATRVICVSDAIRSAVAGRNARATTIYNGVERDPDVARRPSGAALAALSSGSYVLVVGRVTAHKRILDVIAAVDCPELSGLKVVVCGGLDGADAYIAAVKAAARKSAVVLAGFVPPAELPWLYRHAFCTVMASSYEGMPFAVLEALASGSRVVLSEIPAHRELGLSADSYFPVGDVAQLRARLVRLFGGAGRSEPEAPSTALDARFDWDGIAEATAAVLDAAAARSARGAAAVAQRRAGGP